MAEASNDGKLVRQFHKEPHIKISHKEGSKYIIQRIATNEHPSFIKIFCKSVYVSKHHCKIYRRDKAYWIMDVKSANGTYLNGVKLIPEKERELRFDDIIGIGISHDFHDGDEAAVNPDNKDVYIFKFVKDDVVIVDLEDDEDLEILQEIDNTAQSESSRSRASTDQNVPVSVKRSEKISPEPPSPNRNISVPPKSVEKSSTKATSSTTNRATISTSDIFSNRRSFVPPAPPPPVITTPSTSNSPAGQTSTSASNNSVENNNAPNLVPNINDKHQNKGTDADVPVIEVSNKRQLVTKHNDKPPKRCKFDERKDRRSSDDSSDGLGEIQDDYIELPNSNKPTPVQNALDESDDDIIDIESWSERPFHGSNRASSVDKAKSFSGPDLVSPKSDSSSDRMEVDDDDMIVSSESEYSGEEGEEKRRSPTKDTCQDVRKDINLCSDEDDLFRVDLEDEEVRDDSSEGREVECVESGSSDGEEEGNEQQNQQLQRFSTKEPESPATSKSTTTQPRRLQMITDAPPPRQARKAQLKHGAFKLPIAPSASKIQKKVQPSSASKQILNLFSPSVPLSREEQKRLRTEKLREIELSKPKEDASKRTPKPKTTPKVKVTSRNRNDTMLESIMNSEHQNTNTSSGNPGPSSENESSSGDAFADSPPVDTNDNPDRRPKKLVLSPESRSDVSSMKKAPAKEPVTAPMWLSDEQTAAILGGRDLPLSKEGTRIDVPVTKEKLEASRTSASSSKPVSAHTLLSKVRTNESALNSAGKSTEPKGLTEKTAASTKDQSDPSLPPVGLRDPRLFARPHNPNPVASSSSNRPESRPNGFHNSAPQDRTHNASTARSIPTPSAQGRKPGPSVLKPGAKPILSPTSGIGSVRSFIDPVKKSATKQLKSRALTLTIPEDEIYKRILRWNADWLEEEKRLREQQKIADPPLLTENETLTMTLLKYENFEAYFKIYFPLLLFEFWASITNDNSNRDQSKKSSYSAKIEVVDVSKECKIMRKIKESPAEETEDDKHRWVYVTYHTWVKTRGEIDTTRNLCIVQVKVTDSDKGKSLTRSLLGYCLPNTQKWEVATRENCDQRLKAKGNEQGYRLREQIMCRLSHYVIDKRELIQITRVSYITPKLREFQALRALPMSGLADQIISPVEDLRYSWSSLLATKHSYNELISTCFSLNTEQKAVVRLASQRVDSHEPELMLMHGPPGTGKTRTIVSLVLQIIVTNLRRYPSRHPRILICTPSNAAIDEIMRRLEYAIKGLPKTGKPIEMLRIGEGYHHSLKKYTPDAKVEAMKHSKSTVQSIKTELDGTEKDIDELTREILEMKKNQAHPITIESKQQQLQEVEKKRAILKRDYNSIINKEKTVAETQTKRLEVITGSHIVCTTLASSNTSNMKAFTNKIPESEKAFLCCIVDEASQTTEPETLLPLLLSIDKLMLVGDPFQLGATVKSSSAEDKNYGQSLFKRHFEFHKRNKKGSPVMSLVQQYRMHEQIANWPNIFFYEGKLKTVYQEPDPKYPLRPYLFLNLSAGREHAEREGQIQNTDEAAMVKALVDTIDDMLTILKKRWTVGVITPYSAQKQILREEFAGKVFKNFTSLDIESVDGFQGQEKDIIVVSCVRTDAMGFLNSPNRLNVAITRAKHSLYIIGDSTCLSQHNMWKCLIQEAARSQNKWDVSPSFKADIKLLKNQLRNQLSKQQKT